MSISIIGRSSSPASIFAVQIILLLLLLSHTTHGKLITLPANVRPEGIAHLRGNDFIASDVETGSVYMINVASHLLTRVSYALPDRHAFGLFASSKYVLAAGGGSTLGDNYTAQVVVYEMATGVEVVACEIPNAGFINDLVLDDEEEFAYMTDSTSPYVYVMRMSSLPNCELSNIQLPAAQFEGTGKVHGNGIVLYNGGLIISNSHMETLYFIDLADTTCLKEMGERSCVSTILLPGTLPNVDGLSMDGEDVIAAQTWKNMISRWRLSANGRTVSATLLKQYSSSELRTPSSCVVHNGTMVVANLDLTQGSHANSGTVFTVAIIDA